jgi:hypothetical protein
MSNALTPRRKVEARAKELCAKLVIRNEGNFTTDRKEVLIEAPKGHLWSATFTHELVHAVPGHMSIVPLWPDALERMTYGVIPCAIDDCDWCAEDDTEG